MLIDLGPNRAHVGKSVNANMEASQLAFTLSWGVTSIKSSTFIRRYSSVCVYTVERDTMKALIVLEQPCWRRASRQDKVVPPPGLLHSLLASLAQISHQGVALVLVIRVEAVVGAH